MPGLLAIFDRIPWKKRISSAPSLETARNAEKEKVYMPENVVNITLERCRLFPGEARTSMQLDREQGRPMELETLVGCVCRQGQKLKVPTPTYDRVYSELKTQ